MNSPSTEARSKVTTETGLPDGVITPRLATVPSAARLQSWYWPPAGAVGTAIAWTPESGALKTMGARPWGGGLATEATRGIAGSVTETEANPGLDPGTGAVGNSVTAGWAGTSATLATESPPDDTPAPAVPIGPGRPDESCPAPATEAVTSA